MSTATRQHGRTGTPNVYSTGRRFWSQARIGGKTRYLGTHDTEAGAADAIREARGLPARNCLTLGDLAARLGKAAVIPPSRRARPAEFRVEPHDGTPTQVVSLPAERLLLLQSARARRWAENPALAACAGPYSLSAGPGAFGAVEAPDDATFRRLVAAAVLAGLDVGLATREGGE